MTAEARIAITGATGFVGQAVLDAASDASVALKALARREQPLRTGIDWVAGSLSDRAALERLCRDCDTLIHIAGLTNAPDLADFARANVDGTRNLLDAAAHAGVRRFVFVSSLSAREPQLSAYGASKAQAEALVEASAFDWTIVRPPAVYGPRDSDMFELFRAASFGVVPVPPRGRASIIHVQDLADLLLALAPPDPHTRSALFEPADGNREGLEHGELARLIGDAVGRRVLAPHLPRAVLMLAARADRLLRGDGARLTADRVGYMSHPDWVANPERAVPAAIWQPRIGARQGMAATAQWYREAGWLR